MTDVNLSAFFGEMAALSAASQTLTEHLVKRRFLRQLDLPKPDPVREARRQTCIHIVAGVIGGALAWAANMEPLRSLGVGASPAVDYAVIGVLASYGGGFFNEALDLMRSFKLGQEELRKYVLPGALVAGEGKSADADAFDIRYFDVPAATGPEE